MYHVIKDPAHGTMQFSNQENEWIRPFLDHKHIQRLRHIKQLGLADWFFPGAVHTRFNHSIGCCYVASQIANRLELSPKEKQIVILSALLHDVGHGPFSHTFEQIFHKLSITHEQWTPLFLEDFCKDDFLSKLNYYLNKNDIEFIQSLIMHQCKTKTVLRDIVSSQLDADRLDYLLRDSHFCGVNYGHYDFPWLLDCLTIVEHSDQLRLGLTGKGIGVAEHYLMARRLMMKNVYHHAKKHAAEFLLQMFLKYLSHEIANSNNKFNFLPSPYLIEFLKKTYEFNERAKYTLPENMNLIVSDFIAENHGNYQQLCDYDVFIVLREIEKLNDSSDVVSIAKRLQNRILPKIIYLNDQQVDAAKSLISHFKSDNQSVSDWQIEILKLPHLSYAGDISPILIKHSSGKIDPLHEDSIIINALSGKTENIYIALVDSVLLNEQIGKLIFKELSEL